MQSLRLRRRLLDRLGKLRRNERWRRGKPRREGPGDGAGNGVERSGRGLSKEAFELGEDLLDRIEVGRVFGKKQEARRAPTALMAFRTAFPLWEPRLSRMTMSLGLSVGTGNCST